MDRCWILSSPASPAAVCREKKNPQFCVPYIVAGWSLARRNLTLQLSFQSVWEGKTDLLGHGQLDHLFSSIAGSGLPREKLSPPRAEQVGWVRSEFQHGTSQDWRRSRKWTSRHKCANMLRAPERVAHTVERLPPPPPTRPLRCSV